MWLSIIIMALIFMAFGYYVNDIVRIVAIEIREVRKEFDHENRGGSRN